MVGVDSGPEGHRCSLLRQLQFNSDGDEVSTTSRDSSDCVKNVILSEAKDFKWPKNEILRYTQNDKKRGKCFFTQPVVQTV